MSLDAIRRAVEAFSGEKIGGLDAAALLYATWIAESGDTADPRERYEKAYDVGGVYSKNKLQAELLARYGADAARSWGPFQIMPVVAWELGYRYAPGAFKDAHLAAQVVLAYYRKRFAAAGGTTPEQAYAAYNGGNIGAVSNPVVQKHTARFMGAWNNFYSVVKPSLPVAGGGLLLILLIIAGVALARKPDKP